MSRKEKLLCSVFAAATILLPARIYASATNGRVTHWNGKTMVLPDSRDAYPFREMVRTYKKALPYVKAEQQKYRGPGRGREYAGLAASQFEPAVAADSENGRILMLNKSGTWAAYADLARAKQGEGVAFFPVVQVKATDRATKRTVKLGRSAYGWYGGRSLDAFVLVLNQRHEMANGNARFLHIDGTRDLSIVDFFDTDLVRKMHQPYKRFGRYFAILEPLDLDTPSQITLSSRNLDSPQRLRQHAIDFGPLRELRGR